MSYIPTVPRKPGRLVSGTSTYLPDVQTDPPEAELKEVQLPQQVEAAQEEQQSSSDGAAAQRVKGLLQRSEDWARKKDQLERKVDVYGEDLDMMVASMMGGNEKLKNILEVLERKEQEGRPRVELGSLGERLPRPGSNRNEESNNV